MLLHSRVADVTWRGRPDDVWQVCHVPPAAAASYALLLLLQACPSSSLLSQTDSQSMASQGRLLNLALLINLLLCVAICLCLFTKPEVAFQDFFEDKSNMAVAKQIVLHVSEYCMIAFSTLMITTLLPPSHCFFLV